MSDPNPSPAAVTAWARLLAAQRIALQAVERELKAAGFPPLGWYDALLELKRAGGALRPNELEGRLLLAQHNVSRLIDRLEKAGYARRAPCDSDGRGQVVELTAAGAELLDRMWPLYRSAIARHVGRKLGGEEEAALLTALLGKLIG